MTDPSPATLSSSPAARRTKTPSWLDLRLVLGVLLVLVSVVIGASVLSSADHRQARWAITRDLAAGTVLTRDDVRPVRVQLGSADTRYLPVTDAVVGKSVRDQVQAGELLPRGELDTPAEGVAVTVALKPENGPDIDQGDRITLWLSTKTCQGVVLLSGVAVQEAEKSGSSGFGADAGSVLVVRVSAGDAQRLVSALDLDGAVIRAGVLSLGQQPDPVAPDLTACAGAAK
ncbi:MAG: SAF domain-containing protein [Jatrophihabitans sp.]